MINIIFYILKYNNRCLVLDIQMNSHLLVYYPSLSGAVEIYVW